MATVTPDAIQAILQQMGARITPEALRFGEDWEQAEGGGAENNPWNTTQPGAGATNYNSVGVKNYPNLKSGITATAQTLLNGHYTKLVDDLRSGRATAQQLAADVASSPWGTGSLVEKVVAGDGGKYEPAPVSAGKSAVGNAIGALGGGTTSGASMADTARQNLLNMVLGSSKSIASGQGVQTANPEQLLQLLSQSTQGGEASTSGSSPQGGTGAGGVVGAAQQYLGVPYKWGGTDPKTGLDCSAFLQKTMADVGVKIPRTTQEQIKVGTPVNLKDLQPGDAVFTEPGASGPNHVGLYIGNGKIQESPHTGEDNKIIPLQTFLGGGFVGARRYAPNTT